MMKKSMLVLTCEHAGNQIPSTFQYLFNGADEQLQSHRGWDPGSLEITQALAKQFEVAYFAYDYTRLLIDVNRSEKHPQLYSAFSGKLMAQDKNYLLKTYYQPHRRKVEGIIRDFIEENYVVVHVGVHTFTPFWEGHERQVDVGLLFDEGRKTEVTFCQRWLQELNAADCSLKARFNKPYKGADDGFTTYLRTRFSQDTYLGLELEVNQKFIKNRLTEVSQTIGQSLKSTFSKSYITFPSASA